jgi:hypothetical protein
MPAPLPEGITVSLPIVVLAGAFAEVVVVYNASVASIVDDTIALDWYTGRHFEVSPQQDPGRWFVETTIPDGSITRPWGANKYVAEEHAITYRWKPSSAPPIFDKWRIDRAGVITESSDNPITLVAGTTDVVVTPIVIEPVP